MSFFGKLFGGKKEDEGASPAEAIQKLRDTEEMLIKKQDFLEKKIEEYTLIAKKNASKNKRVALQALKKKKRLEKNQLQIDGTLTTIELQREALEGASTNTTVLESMKNAAEALKKAHKNLDVDNVHDIMDDIAEQHDIANEISNAISNPVGFSDDLDDAELEKELEELEQEGLEEDLLKVPGPTELPAVPTGAIAKPVKPAKKVEEDDDMKELEAWAS
ncbi:charged multivesicular body protein shrub [Leptinotarsa decemlineata]|uniref:charged multivesicular body protein shrub n=1 Tax=Leptinotarsa decemlineata TaxID=7539 RepID=UPI000C2536D4|nr:charged multivesicular body protein 4b [Leptinotarsa decemlineata]